MSTNDLDPVLVFVIKLVGELRKEKRGIDNLTWLLILCIHNNGRMEQIQLLAYRTTLLLFIKQLSLSSYNHRRHPRLQFY